MPKGVYDHAKPKGKQVSAQMWRKLEAEYLAGDCTLKDLSDKYGIAYNSILNYSRKNGWVVKKSEHGERVYKKAMEEFDNRSVQNMLRVDNIADKLLDKIERAVDELSLIAVKNTEKKRKIEVDEEGSPMVHETTKESYDTKELIIDRAGLRSITAALRDIKEVKMIRSNLDREEQAARLAKLKKEAEQDNNDISVTVKIESEAGEEYGD